MHWLILRNLTIVSAYRISSCVGRLCQRSSFRVSGCDVFVRESISLKMSLVSLKCSVIKSLLFRAYASSSGSRFEACLSNRSNSLSISSLRPTEHSRSRIQCSCLELLCEDLIICSLLLIRYDA